MDVDKRVVSQSGKLFRRGSANASPRSLDAPVISQSGLLIVFSNLLETSQFFSGILHCSPQVGFGLQSLLSPKLKFDRQEIHAIELDLWRYLSSKYDRLSIN